MSCPQDSGVFKLRRDLLKTLTVILTQTSNRDLRVDRCFGMLVSPGRNIKNSDMHLIEMVRTWAICDYSCRMMLLSNSLVEIEQFASIIE